MFHLQSGIDEVYDAHTESSVSESTPECMHTVKMADAACSFPS